MNLMDKFTPQTDDVTFGVVQEPWTIYRLEDGTEVRVRLNLVKATRSGNYTPEGIPIFNFQFAQVMDVTPSESLKAEAAKRVKETK